MTARARRGLDRYRGGGVGGLSAAAHLADAVAVDAARDFFDRFRRSDGEVRLSPIER